MEKNTDSPIRKWKAEDIGSLVALKISKDIFEGYERYEDEKGRCRIQGVRWKDEISEIVSKPDHLLRMYKLGKSIEEALLKQGQDGISHKLYQSIYLLVLGWVEQNGLPCHSSPLKKDFRIQDGYYDYEHSIMNTFDVNEFARCVLMFRDCVDFVLAVKHKDFGYKNTRTYRLHGLDDSNLDDTLMVPAYINSGLETEGGISPVFTLNSHKKSYSLIMEAKTHLGIAYAQLGFSLLGPSVARCSVCEEIFLKDSKSLVCGDDCRRKRASQYVKATNNKPLEDRDPKFTPKRKRKFNPDGQL